MQVFYDSTTGIIYGTHADGDNVAAAYADYPNIALITLTDAQYADLDSDVFGPNQNRPQVIHQRLDLTRLPATPPAADWSGWQTAVFADPAFAWICANMTTQGSALWSILLTLIGQVQSQPETLDRIVTVWGVFSAALDIRPETKAHLAAIARTYTLPEAFIETIYS